MWCSSPQPSLWLPCVRSLTTSSRSAAMPSSSALACRGPSASEWRASASGRSEAPVQPSPGENADVSALGQNWKQQNCLFSPSQTAMEVMGLIAIIVNCYLIGQCGQLQRLFPWLSPEMAIISIVILEVWHTLLRFFFFYPPFKESIILLCPECRNLWKTQCHKYLINDPLFLLFLQHFAILLKYVIHVAIPDIPTWVQEEMTKLDYQRREAFKVNLTADPKGSPRHSSWKHKYKMSDISAFFPIKMENSKCTQYL